MKIYETLGILRTYLESEDWKNLAKQNGIEAIKYFTGDSKIYNLEINAIREKIAKEIENLEVINFDNSLKWFGTIENFKQTRKNHILVGKDSINRLLKIIQQNLGKFPIDICYIPEASKYFENLQRTTKLNYNKINKKLIEIYNKN